MVRHTYSLIPQTLEYEREISKNFTNETKYDQVERNGKMRQYYSDAFAKAYQEKLGTMVEQQMSAAGRQIASFWYTA